MTISVRIVNMDHYMTKPGPLDRAITPFSPNPLLKVPVIRIFGSTLAGQKICLHIHQVYPYFFVPYNIPKEFSSDQQIQRDIFQFGTSLNEAMNIAKPHAIKDQHIVAIVLTKGVPFYGYHVGYQSFLKIYISNPADKQHMLNLLQSQAILGLHFQPHEAHCNFELQFLMDHNLFGMDWLHIEQEIPHFFRLPLSSQPKSFYLSQDSPIYTAATVPASNTDDTVPRESYCELELDITSMSILNRLDLVERNMHCDIQSECETQNKLVKSLDIIWKDEARRRQGQGVSEPIHVSQNDVPREPHVPWLSEPALRQRMEKMMKGASFQHESSPLLSDVMTVFQAIEALYPDDYTDWKQRRLQSNVVNSPQRTPVSSQQRSVLFNVSATPTRYRDWNISSQLDKSIIHSLIQEPSFYVEEEEDDPYFSPSDSLTDSKLAEWVEALEQIEYESRDRTEQLAPPMDYEPRKLDFESDHLKKNTSSIAKPPKIDIFSTDIEDMPFLISSVPPTSGPRHGRKRRRRINQLDGPNDPHEPKHLKTSAEKWETQRQQLKNMRRRKPTSKPIAEYKKEQNKSRSDWIKKRYRKAEERFTKCVSVNALEQDTASQEAQNYSHDSVGSESSPTSHSPVSSTESQLQNNSSLHELSIEIVPTSPQNQNSPPQDKTPECQDSSSEHQDSLLEYRENSSQYQINSPQYLGSSLEYHHRSPQHEQSSPQYQKNSPRHELSTRTLPSSPQQKESSPQNEDISSRHELSHETSSSIPSEEAHTGHSENTPLHHTTLSVSLSSDEFNFVPASFGNYSTELVYNHSPPVIQVPTTEVYKEPFYSIPSDLPAYPTVFSGKEFKLPTSATLKEFQSTFQQSRKISLEHTRIKQWSPAVDPPTYQQVLAWSQSKNPFPSSQLDEPTLDNTFDFKLNQTKPQVEIKVDNDFIDYFSLEIHVNTRGELLPDPKEDPVQILVWCLQTQDKCFPVNGYQGNHVGIIALKSYDLSKVGLSSTRAMIDYADTEEEMFSFLINRIRHFDPDMLVGYEVQNASWGYLVERGVELGINLIDELSRVYIQTDSIRRDQWGYQKTAVYKITGRHLLNVWRLMKGELTLTSYTFENVAYHLLHDRVPHYSHETLTTWYSKVPAVLKYRLLKYYLKRVQMNLDMLDASQVVTRTCESARVFGVDFHAVLSRGSQFKVESIMFRIAKPENYVLITPSRKQVAEQRSLECLPLVMEPVSQFYSSPMVVLDFQSLYPSIIIAYNYCYSTCLGRVRDLEESSRFGVESSFDLKDGLLDSLKDSINISPNGIMFVKPEIRKSLLAKMLAELLDTRVMIKSAMKDYKADKGLLRLLDAKQLTLKLLANVTYGYTSASFSGRMPSVEIADSIVSTGRETLERAIKLINETEKWGARVVYGDTDSVFVYFPGKTKEEAFTLGHEIANTVTQQNPAPMKLKFEKVYHPAVLLAKKRYVGFKYEHPSDKEPVFEAKGIETVRRDGTPATQKILESCLKILFRTQDMSELKQYLWNQWTKILSNRVLLQEYIISKEVKMGTYSDRGGPSGAQIAQAKMDVDVRAEPQYGERVPYVVVYRGPKAKLKDKVVRPEELLADNTLKLDAEYYIRKQIVPPLSRVFNLMGVDIEAWYDAMPRSQKAEALALATIGDDQAGKKISRIDQYYASSHCTVCRQITDGAMCPQCRSKPYDTIFALNNRQQIAQDKYRKILQTCQDCSGLSPLDAMSVQKESAYADIPCNSLDCPIFYERCKAQQDVKITSNYTALLESIYD